MDVKLVVVGGATLQASEFALKLPTVVGRSRSVDLPLANALVSRKHCEIFEDDGQLMVRDLGSLNGTFVGKSRVEETAAVPAGSLLTIGAITFRADYAGVNGVAIADADEVEAVTNTHIGSDDPTIDVDELDTLEPLAEAGGSEEEFSLSWLEEGDGASPLQDSIGADEPAAVKKTIATKASAPAKNAKQAAKAKSAAETKAKSSDDSDNLDDLCS
jgi:predicted component of type VI protein secretion system